MDNRYPTLPDLKVSGNTWLNSTHEESGRVWILPELFRSGMDIIHTQPIKKKKKKKTLNLSPSLTLPLLSPHRHSLSLRALQSLPLLIVTLSLLELSNLRLSSLSLSPSLRALQSIFRLIPRSLRINWVFLPLSFLR